MNSLSVLAALSVVLTSCSTAERGREQVLSRDEFKAMAPSQVRKYLEDVFQDHDWNALIEMERRYRSSSVDVVWVFGKDKVTRSWVVKKGQWLRLQGATQSAALTAALQADIHRLKWCPTNKKVSGFVYAVVRLIQGDGGTLLEPSLVETIDKILHIERSLGIKTSDRSHEVIKPLCRSIECQIDRSGTIIVFNYLFGGGCVQEWRILFDKSSIQWVHVRNIWRDEALDRWIPTS